MNFSCLAYLNTLFTVQNNKDSVLVWIIFFKSECKFPWRKVCQDPALQTGLIQALGWVSIHHKCQLDDPPVYSVAINTHCNNHSSLSPTAVGTRTHQRQSPSRTDWDHWNIMVTPINFWVLPPKSCTALTFPDKDPPTLTRNISIGKTITRTFRISFWEIHQGMRNGFKSGLVNCNRRQITNCWYSCLPNIPCERQWGEKSPTRPVFLVMNHLF